MTGLETGLQMTEAKKPPETEKFCPVMQKQCRTDCAWYREVKVLDCYKNPVCTKVYCGNKLMGGRK